MSILDDRLCLPIDNPLVVKSLKHLSREALADLAQDWLRAGNSGVAPPNLDTVNGVDDGSLHRPAFSVDGLRAIYQALLQSKASKKELLERLTEIDWKSGLSMRQVAEVDLRDIKDRPASMRWSALNISKRFLDLDKPYRDFATARPRTNIKLDPTEIIDGLQRELGLLLKLHILQSRFEELDFNLVRIATVVGDHYVDADRIVAADGENVRFKVMWMAFQQLGSRIFIAPPSAGQIADQTDIEAIIIGTLPKIFARHGQYYAIEADHGEPMPLPNFERVMRKQIASEHTTVLASKLEGNPLLSI